MVFVKKGVVLPLGDTGDFDDDYTYQSTILYHNGRLYMYYSGYDDSKRRIGLAISEDGLTFVKKGVVVPLGDTDDFDDNDSYAPAILHHNGRFYLYYSGYDASKRRIGLAISEDGLTFVKKGVVLPLGAIGDFDDHHTYLPAILYHNGRFYMYYSGDNGSNARIGLAISTDGLTFVKKGVVLPLGATGDFDDNHTYAPAILHHNGHFYLYYSGHDDSKYRIGLGISEDGLTFTKKGVVLPLGATSDFDDNYTYAPAILYHNGRFYLYYSGYDGSNARIGLAISEDGL